ncbi:hypothetical protein L9G15_02025 [Shewanella sp. A3A]|nr:hypothetical protein [Shewanella ferrihydritica]
MRRAGKCFIRYDAGAHTHIWREDEIAAADAEAILSAVPNTVMDAITKVLWQLQQQQVNAPQSNWLRE